ncbi:hypothetical protein CFHF_24570 [Caulobacter flavus]|uniref:Alginate export domain-containing protein n=1 Tax=Caulobacter flavus TaxID=1679497 RepID=A0A2N5CLM1_9CAUL|nr:alginate export family protein [Caulobacter flavus]AYV48861.1 hypothetical protein C1707_22810 [Caulobacter flavus]PLR06681.1 hypothetical protein CFHF_24570 [Caulobacter flavus]
MNKSHVVCVGLMALAWSSGASAQEASLLEAVKAGRPLLEIRARYERFDQTKTATLRNDAEGTTVRTRFGWETGGWHDVKALIEFDDVRRVGPEHFAITTPGVSTPLNGADKARYPAINDPNVTEVNRAQLQWTPSKALQLTAGRQKIQFDDQRFVAAAAWRQDEQTYDGLRTDLTLSRFRGTYVYVTRVNRALGERRDWDSDSHFVNATWTFSEALKATAFVYALDFSDSPVNTSITKGVRGVGRTKAGPYTLTYSGAFARQSDYHRATADYELDYLGGEFAATRGIYTAQIGYHMLEGDGTRGFGAPLGAAHGFYGWADAWSSLGGNKSFADGLDDLNFTVTVKPKIKARGFTNPELLVRYHDFDDDRTGADLGHEWNAQLTATIAPKLSAQLKYAGFDRVDSVPSGTLAPPASRKKVWFTLEYKL